MSAFIRKNLTFFTFNNVDLRISPVSLSLSLHFFFTQTHLGINPTVYDILVHKHDSMTPNSHPGSPPNWATSRTLKQSIRCSHSSNQPDSQLPSCIESSNGGLVHSVGASNATLNPKSRLSKTKAFPHPTSQG
ncbi:hypothetical protein AAHA92_24841 [Salvia divinorum]|uniref:Uncharacterized protein n=1 Tax=Salvia divinorum TaxID=28513 RepID=A0ABD1G8P2_SALDI